MQKSVIFRLSENSAQAVRFLSGVSVTLADGKKTSWITLTRTGSFTDPRYGSFDITNEMLLSMVSNFHKGTYGQDIVVDLNHDIKGGAAADIKDLKVEGNRLRALVEWTPQGIEAVKNKRMKYLSAEFHPDYKDNEKGNKHGPTLLGAALTVRPVIKHLDPVELAEQNGASPVYIHPELINQLYEEEKTLMQTKGEEGSGTGASARHEIKRLQDSGMSLEEISTALSHISADAGRSAGTLSSILTGEISNPPSSLIKALKSIKSKTLSEETKIMKSKYLALLAASSAIMALSESTQNTMATAYGIALGENPTEETAKKQLAEFEAAAVALAKTDSQQTKVESLTTDDINAAVTKALADRDAAAVKLTEDRDAKVKLFTKTINKAEGLSADVKKKLCEDSDLITPEMSDKQVKKFAERQISHGNDVSIAQQLSALGYHAAGSGSESVLRTRAGSV